MKTLTVRLPADLVGRIKGEARNRRVTQSDVVRERLEAEAPHLSTKARDSALDSIADLIGAVDRLPADLSARKKHHLRSTGYGETRDR